MLKVACFIESQQNRGNIPQYQRIIVSLCDGGEANPTEKKKKTERERDSTILSFPDIIMLSHFHVLESYHGTHKNEEQQGATTLSFLQEGPQKWDEAGKKKRSVEKFTWPGQICGLG